MGLACLYAIVFALITALTLKFRSLHQELDGLHARIVSLEKGVNFRESD